MMMEGTIDESCASHSSTHQLIDSSSFISNIIKPNNMQRSFIVPYTEHIDCASYATTFSIGFFRT